MAKRNIYIEKEIQWEFRITASVDILGHSCVILVSLKKTLTSSNTAVNHHGKSIYRRDVFVKWLHTVKFDILGNCVFVSLVLGFGFLMMVFFFGASSAIVADAAGCFHLWVAMIMVLSKGSIGV